MNAHCVTHGLVCLLTVVIPLYCTIQLDSPDFLYTEPAGLVAYQPPISPQITFNFRAPLIYQQVSTIGEFRVSVHRSTLRFRYDFDSALTMETAHLFIGENDAEIPLSGTGSPQVGNFPYGATGLSEQGSFQFEIPMSDLIPTGQTREYLCGRLFFLAAHAELRDKQGALGGSWAEGPLLFSGGSWATYSNFLVECSPPVPLCFEALAQGGRSLTEFSDTLNWGWVNMIHREETSLRPLYARVPGPGPAKLIHVGEFSYSYNGFQFSGTYRILPDFKLRETNFHAGMNPPRVDSLRSLGGRQAHLGGKVTGVTANGFGYPFYLVAHARVCEAF